MRCIYRILVLILACWNVWVATRGHAAAPQDQASDSPGIIFLHTERIPYKHRVPDDYQYLMMRELARQGFLLTAHLDFGFSIRDETLGENIPNNSNVMHLALTERANSKREWQMKLFRSEEMLDSEQVAELWPREPVWTDTFEYLTGVDELYDFAANVFDCASFDEFRTAILALGVEEPPKSEALEPLAPAADAVAAWNSDLLRVDFVTQYGVVREVHQAIETYGESAELLGILSRAYANLSLLTDHHANASSRAFAARALILSARSARTFTNDDTQRLNQVYVWAIIGHHAIALQRQSLLVSVEPADFSDRPWVALLTPYLQGDLTSLRQLGNGQDEISPWAFRLWFELAKGYRYETWMRESLEHVSQHVPTAYGTYAMLASRVRRLGIKRQASYLAPGALAKELPASVKPLSGLPEAVLLECRDAAKPKFAWPFNWGNEPSPSARPKRLRDGLYDASLADTHRGISWSALAFLIEEEQFAQSYNTLLVATDAVETSLSDLVRTALRDLGDHRYADWLRSYRYRARDRDQEEMELLHGLQVSDIRGNMWHMWMTVRHVERQMDPSHWKPDRWFAPCIDFTLQGYIDNSALGGIGSRNETAETMRHLAHTFRTIVPNSALNVRFDIQYAESPDVSQLLSWEKQLQEDATAFKMLGVHHLRLHTQTGEDSYLDHALRCFTKSQNILLESETAHLIASVHLAREDYDQWEATLVDFLDSDYQDSGIARATISKALASGLADQGKWYEAKPHALDAASTYSAWGLRTASAIAEGLTEWAESEMWIRQLSQSYPSSSAHRWYYWCVRTGRGDQANAKQLADKFFSAQKNVPNANGLRSLAIYRIIEGDLEAATQLLKQEWELEKRLGAALFLTHLARARGDDQAAVELLNQIENVLKLHPGDKVAQEGLETIKLFRKGDAPREDFATRVNSVLELPRANRCSYLYHLGRQLEEQGEEAEAVRLFQMALDYFREDHNYSTLAGAELCERFGTSRKDDDTLDTSGRNR